MAQNERYCSENKTGDENIPHDVTSTFPTSLVAPLIPTRLDLSIETSNLPLGPGLPTKPFRIEAS